MLSVEIMENQIIFTKEQIIKIVNYGKNGVYLYSAIVKRLCDGGFYAQRFFKTAIAKPVL